MFYMIYNNVDRCYNQNNSGETYLYKDLDFLNQHRQEANIESLEYILDSMDKTYFYAYCKKSTSFEDLNYILEFVKNTKNPNYRKELLEFIDKVGFEACSIHKCVFADYLE